jgi:hypothetical protein
MYNFLPCRVNFRTRAHLQQAAGIRSDDYRRVCGASFIFSAKSASEVCVSVTL